VRDDEALEDAYLLGVRLRAVARPGGADAAFRALARWGRPQVSEPSLEDVFVSLARGHAREQEARA
jgi:hypothetical protein